MDKLSLNFQERFMEKLIFDESILNCIDPSVKLHQETLRHPLSSSASCINVLGSMIYQPLELKNFLNNFGLKITKLFPFPSGANIGGQSYIDKGYIVFEWIGPKISPINEKAGGRGFQRTSIDAFIIAEIEGKITQLLIEWKFTEGKSRPLVLEKFAGNKGLERLRRYSEVLVPIRNTERFPFRFTEEKGFGLYDFSTDHLYQLLRMTLLAKKTTPLKIGDLLIEDYRIIHLSHSMNSEIEILHNKYLSHSPGFQKYGGERLYDFWIDILSEYERKKFVGGNWDVFVPTIKIEGLREYLTERYFYSEDEPINVNNQMKIKDAEESEIRISGKIHDVGIHPDKWHFSHLGFDYFERIISKISEYERKRPDYVKSNIQTIGIGCTGVPYILKRDGRKVNPNWHVKTKEGNSYRGKAFETGNLWPEHEVISVEWQEVLDWFWPKH
jgi:hypothetical protein